MNDVEERYVTVKESIEGSCKEIKEMRSGQASKPSWNDFKEEIATGGYITKDIKETIDLEHKDYYDINAEIVIPFGQRTKKRECEQEKYSIEIHNPL